MSSNLAEILQDKVERIKFLLEIEGKDRNLVPLIPNTIQNDILTTQTGADIYVKPSQIGASSIIIGDYLLDTLTQPGTVSVIISHEEFITQRLLYKAQKYYDRLKERIPTIPDAHHKSANLKTYPDINSSFYIGSARGYIFGRGETIHNLLCDEYAFWDDSSIGRIMAPAIQRKPMECRVQIISTPNGEANSFHDIYTLAKDGKAVGKSVFTPHFYPWFMHEEYRISKLSPYCLPGDATDDLDLTEEEAMLVELKGVDRDQIRWRRRKIVEFESLRKSGEFRVLFKQEYPEDDSSCFLVAGDMAYDPDILEDMSRHCYPAPDKYNKARVWFKPEPDLRYIVSCDPGVARISETVITVWHFYTDEDGISRGKHCASLSGLILPGDAGRLSVDLARYYNNALVTWDAGSQGQGFGEAVRHYGNVYLRRDIISGLVSRKEVGWLTTPKTKTYMYEQMVAMLPYIESHDINFVSQCKNMRWNGRKLIAVGLDDFHDSGAMAVCCRQSAPVQRGLVGVSGWQDW